MKSDIEIARSVELKKIKQVAESIGIPRDEVENYGRYIDKITEYLIRQKSNCRFARTFLGTVLRNERRRGRRRLCPGTSDGED